MLVLLPRAWTSWCDPLLFRAPPPGPRVNAACFGAMGVGFLCDPLLCYPPYTAPRLDAACFGAMDMGGLGDAFLCHPSPGLG